MSEQDYTIGSGNVFADLGLENPEELQLKAKLTHLINRIVKQRGWTQQQTYTETVSFCLIAPAGPTFKVESKNELYSGETL